MPCSTCDTKNVTGFFQLKDNGRLCFLCLDHLRYKCHIKLDDIHELTTDEAKNKLISEISCDSKSETNSE